MIGPMFSYNRKVPILDLQARPEFEVATTLSGSEIVTNGNFSSGTTGWSFGTGWSHVSVGTGAPYARLNSSASAATLTQVASFDTSKVHRLSFITVSVTGVEWLLKIEVGGSLTEYIQGRAPHQGIRQYYFDFKPTTGFSVTNIKFTGWAGSSTLVGIDGISIQEATATKTISVNQWGIAGIIPAKGNYDAPTEAMSDVWVGGY